MARTRKFVALLIVAAIGLALFSYADSKGYFAEPAPSVQGLFTVEVLDSSDFTGMTEAGETASGHEWRVTGSDSAFSSATALVLDLRVVNTNDPDDGDQFTATFTITFVFETAAGASIFDKRAFGSKYDVDWSTLSTGSPEVSNVGHNAESRDFPVGGSDTFRMTAQLSGEIANLPSGTTTIVRVSAVGSEVRIVASNTG